MILVVDDIAENRYLLEAVLKGAGYDVVAATNGVEALALAQKTAPDLIVTDILMPKMDGFELCRRWKGDERLKDVPFVFYTATYTDSRDEAFALSLGADRFLVKPLRTDALLGIVEELLRSHARPAVSEQAPGPNDKAVLEQYHEILFHKLEKKVAQLESEIDARRRSEKALFESETQYRRLFESATDGIILVDYESSRVVDVNPSFEVLSGRSGDEAIGRTVRELGILTDAAFERARTDLRDSASVRFDDVTLRRKDGSGIDIEFVSNTYVVGDARVIQCNLRDITERKRAEEQARFDAFHDRVTSLPNRALFVDRLGMAIARAKRNDEYLFAVLFVDIDKFKLVNDSLGHQAGDELLIAIARRFSPSLREADTLARWGGDVFAVLLDGIENPGDATRIAERIQDELRVPFSVAGEDVYVTASVGMTLYVPTYERPEEVVRDADTAVYRAKALGRNGYSVFDDSMHAHSLALLKLESDMRRALERQEFRLHFQPIVTLDDANVTGFEALVRWLHPERGLLAPAEFIASAEETGLIVPLGNWVLREACRQMRSWLDSDGLINGATMNVNVASRQLAEPAFVDDVVAALHEFDLSPSRLKIEITESVLIEHIDVAKSVLAGLRNHGVEVCMDDFGTGYSSLSNLLWYPVDILKIDRAFVAHLGTGNGDSPIVGAILSLARSFGMGVVAEGVETEAQRRRLVELNCVHGQGYLFARPMEAGDAWTFATSRRR